MRAAILFSVAIAAVAGNASPAPAQSLGDVAKREELRRTAVPKPAKTYSNAELKADITAPPAPVAAQPSEAPSLTNTPSNAGADAAVEPPAPAGKPKEDEAAWRYRAGEIRDRVAKAQKMVDAYPGTTTADPREQARTDALIKRAQDELKRAVDAQRLFEMQADVAGVPVAWIK